MPTNLQYEVRRAHGFELFVLRNDAVQLAVVPELGAKVVSLKNVRSGREWMWSPNWTRWLFRNRVQDPFSTGPLVGWDECLPTIAPCQWNGRKLPDHGEIWSEPWRMDATSREKGCITTMLDLPVSPLAFARTLRLEGNAVVAEYTLTNKADVVEPFIWAMHPLLAIEEGDELDLPEAVRTALGGEPWVPALSFGEQPACAKRFVALSHRMGEGEFARVGVVNRLKGERITFEWSPAENDVVGLWLTRGGWYTHHHLAIEPTNATDDSLAKTAGEMNDGAPRPPGVKCGSIAPKQTLFWTVRIHIQS